MKNTFYREYELTKDLPELPSGSLIKWDRWKEMYTDTGETFGLSEPEVKLKYSKDFVDSKPEWFVPVGKPSEFYPKFPSQSEFFDDSDGHCYLGETRHNDMCRTCQLINKIDGTEELKKAVYEVYKKKYEDKFLK